MSQPLDVEGVGTQINKYLNSPTFYADILLRPSSSSKMFFMPSALAVALPITPPPTTTELLLI